MPTPYTAPFSGYGLTVSKQDSHRLQFWMREDGNGDAVLPVRKLGPKVAIGKRRSTLEFVTVLNIPGPALCVMATFMANNVGFRVNVYTTSSVTEFFFLAAY
jgi:hypothetical protein